MTEEIEDCAAILENATETKLVYPPHVAEELERIGERLAAPDPNQHAGLYAAQQALCWAAYPEAFASPFRAIVGSAEG